MNGSPEIYRASKSTGASVLRQGEIVSNLVQIRIRLDSRDAEHPFLDPILHGLAIVLTQDCDLDQDFRARSGENKPDKLAPCVLFAEVQPAADLRGRVGIDSKTWTRIRQNKDERYHFLQKVEAQQDASNLGLPELGIDFKRYFTIPTQEVYVRVAGDAKRRCFLVSPYLEHFSSRFAFYISRVALPEDHFSEPRG